MLKITHLSLLFLTLFTTSVLAEAPLQVVATTADLAAIARDIGGTAVAVTTLATASDDPHFATPKPSFIKVLHQADLFLQTGFDLEIGWLPPLMDQARNSKILPGGEGFFDGSSQVEPLGAAKGMVDRTLGDVHPRGNPHYLLDPLNGIAVAQGIAEKLSRLRPLRKKEFNKNFETFRRAIHTRLVGETLVDLYDPVKLARLFELGSLKDFLEQQKALPKLSGWLGDLLPYVGTQAIDEHDLWIYFANRFGLVVVDHLEARPGVPPSPRHLAHLVSRMTSQDIHLLLAVPYYDPKFVNFVAEKTGSRIARLKHQPSPGETYAAFVDYNVTSLVAALRSSTHP